MDGSPVNLRQQVSDRKRLERAYTRMQTREGTTDLLDADKSLSGARSVAGGAAIAAAFPLAVGGFMAIPDVLNYRGKRRTQLTLERSAEIGHGKPLSDFDKASIHSVMEQLSTPNKEIRGKSEKLVSDLLAKAKARGVDVDVPMEEIRQIFKNSMGNSAKAAIPAGIIGAIGGYVRHRNKRKRKEALIQEALHRKTAEKKMDISPTSVEYFWKEIDAIHAKTASAQTVTLKSAFRDELQKIAAKEKTAIFGFLKKMMGGGEEAISAASRSAAQSRLAKATAPTFENTRKQRPSISLGGQKTPSPAPQATPPSADSLNTPRAEAMRQKAGGPAAIQQRLRDRARGELSNPGGRVDFGNKEDYGTFASGRS